MAFFSTLNMSPHTLSSQYIGMSRDVHSSLCAHAELLGKKPDDDDDVAVGGEGVGALAAFARVRLVPGGGKADLQQVRGVT